MLFFEHHWSQIPKIKKVLFVKDSQGMKIFIICGLCRAVEVQHRPDG